MAAYCVSIFGDMLLDKPLDEFPVSLIFICFVFHLDTLMFTCVPPPLHWFTDSMIGGNKSSEGPEEDKGVEEQGVSGVNIVISNWLVEQTGVAKKSYQKYIKHFIAQLVKCIEEERPGDVDKIKASVSKAVKKCSVALISDKQNLCVTKFFSYNSQATDHTHGLKVAPFITHSNFTIYYFVNSWKKENLFHPQKHFWEK